MGVAVVKDIEGGGRRVPDFGAQILLVTRQIKVLNFPGFCQFNCYFIEIVG